MIQTMTPKERFLTALNSGIPDRVPIAEHLFSLKLQKEVLGYNTILYEGAAQAELAAKLGIDMIWVPVNGFCGIEETPHQLNDVYQDEWGVTYKKNGWPIIAQIACPIKDRGDWNSYKLPEVNTPYRTRIITDAIKENEGKLAIVVGLLGPFTMASWYFSDFESFSFNLFMDPDLIHEMNDAYVNWALEAAKLSIGNGGIDAFQISDDWGGSTSLLISPEQFREFFISPFERLVNGLSELGVPVIMHNDGYIWDVLEELVNTGIKGFHPVEKSAGMDLKLVKSQFKGKLCPIGNVNNKTTMVSGTPAEVEAEVKECIHIGAPGGGYIIATDHSLHDDIPTENVFAFISSAHKYGKYPVE
jgi:uroporphyrinogen decarboxylase